MGGLFGTACSCVALRCRISGFGVRGLVGAHSDSLVEGGSNEKYPDSPPGSHLCRHSFVTYIERVLRSTLGQAILHRRVRTGLNVSQDASPCVRRSGGEAWSLGRRGPAMSNSVLLPFQPDSMSPSQLAAVSYLARYSGHTHSLYAYQLRRWFEWCESNRLDPLVGIQRAHVELYIRSR